MNEADLPVVGDPHAQALDDWPELCAARLVADHPGEPGTIRLELHQLAIQRREPPRLHDPVAAPPDDCGSDDHETHE